MANLQKKQRGLQNELNKKRKEANQLNARIDRLIAEEIEKARKRAAEEARKEAAARKSCCQRNEIGCNFFFRKGYNEESGAS